MRVSGKGMFAVGAWGVSFVATRIALEAFHPFGLVAARLAVGSLILTVIVRLSGGRLMPKRDDLGLCTFLGVVVAAHLLIQAYGLCYTSAVNTGWIIGFIPVAIAVGASLFQKLRMKGVGWLGVATATGGVLLVNRSSPPDFVHATLGDLLQLTSCVTWTVYTLSAGRAVARNGALSVTIYGMFVATIITAAATIRSGVMIGPLTARIAIATLFLGVVCSGLAFYYWLTAQKECGSMHVASLLYIEPFFTVAAAALFIHEPITRDAALGGVVVLLGVWLVSRGTSRAATG